MAVEWRKGPGGLRIIIDPERLTRACVMRGWSFAELGRQAHISAPTIKGILDGKPAMPYLRQDLDRNETIIADAGGGERSRRSVASTWMTC